MTRSRTTLRSTLVALALLASLPFLVHAPAASAGDREGTCTYQEFTKGYPMRTCSFRKTHLGAQISGNASWVLNYGPSAETGTLTFSLYDYNNRDGCSFARLSSLNYERWYSACGQGARTQLSIELNRNVGGTETSGSYKFQLCGSRQIKSCVQLWSQQVDQAPAPGQSGG